MNTTVIGADLPRLDPERTARFATDDKWRYVNGMVPDLRSQGFLKDLTDENGLERAEETADETARALQHAALFEVAVTVNHRTFDLSAFDGAWRLRSALPTEQCCLNAWA